MACARWEAARGGIVLVHGPRVYDEPAGAADMLARGELRDDVAQGRRALDALHPSWLTGRPSSIGGDSDPNLNEHPQQKVYRGMGALVHCVPDPVQNHRVLGPDD